MYASTCLVKAGLLGECEFICGRGMVCFCAAIYFGGLLKGRI
jgi:hypothetical protein